MVNPVIKSLRSLVLRLNNNVILEPVGPERPLPQEDRADGVVWNRAVQLGVHGDGPVFRVVPIASLATSNLFQRRPRPFPRETA
jgi:hypothetical protein